MGEESPKDRLSTGPGGSWTVLNESIDHPGVVKQLSKDSCVAACGEMLSLGRLSQDDLISEIGAPAPLEALAPKLGVNWRSGFVRREDFFQLIALNKKFAAALRTLSTGKYSHAVVVVGLNISSRIVIHDPWQPSQYEMTRDSFMCTGTEEILVETIVFEE